MARRTRDDWRALGAGSFDSGMMVRAYAERHGVATSTLHRWRSQVRHEPEQPAFVEIETDERTTFTGCVVTVGSVVASLESLPPPAWLAELAAAC